MFAHVAMPTIAQVLFAIGERLNNKEKGQMRPRLSGWRKSLRNLANARSVVMNFAIIGAINLGESVMD